MSDPSRNDSFTIKVIYGHLQSLAFYIHGDNTCTTWTWFADYRFDADILCHNDQLYVSYDDWGRFIEVWNFDNKFPKKVTRFEPRLEDEIKLEFCDVDVLYPEAYLMESMGEILYVKRFTCLFYDQEGLAEKIMHHFDVYKLDCCGQRLENVVTLGDEAIFVGRNQSVTVSTRKFGEWKKDSIYFSVWKEFEYLDEMLEFDDLHHVQVYNLEQKAFKPCRDTNMIQHIQRYDPTPFWIIPNPW